MTATDELRRMLDERGVKHYDGVECTYWGDTVLARRDGSCPIYRFNATEVTDGVSVHLLRVSPEQAIEATLGHGTCHAIVSDNLTESEGTGDAWANCSECGHLLCVLTEPSSQMPNYCPNCGRKVVGA